MASGPQAASFLGSWSQLNEAMGFYATAQLWEEGVGREEGEVKAWGKGREIHKSTGGACLQALACRLGQPGNLGHLGARKVGIQEVGGRFQRHWTDEGWGTLRRPSSIPGPAGAGTS